MSLLRVRRWKEIETYLKINSEPMSSLCLERTKLSGLAGSFQSARGRMELRWVKRKEEESCEQ